MSNKIDKLHEALENDSEGVEIELEVLEPESVYYSLTPEEWELYKVFEASKGNKVIYLTGKEEDN